MLKIISRLLFIVRFLCFSFSCLFFLVLFIVIEILLCRNEKKIVQNMSRKFVKVFGVFLFVLRVVSSFTVLQHIYHQCNKHFVTVSQDISGYQIVLLQKVLEDFPVYFHSE